MEWLGRGGLRGQVVENARPGADNQREASVSPLLLFGGRTSGPRKEPAAVPPGEPAAVLPASPPTLLPAPFGPLSMHHAARLNAILLAALFAAPLWGADEPPPTSPVDEEGRVVDFSRHIAPLLRDRCLECHGAEKPKADFRVDDPEILLQYVEPEDPEASMLYMDYVRSEDPDMLMPPPSHGGPLDASEIALIHLWIEEGATWPEDASVEPLDAERVVAGGEKPQRQTPLEPRPLLARIWAFQGYLHPATVHFPIALLMLGGFFVVLGLKWPMLGTQVPLACLLLGSVSAVVASLMGWSLADEQGYPGYMAGLDKEVNWHRWSGIFLAVLSVVLAVVAVVATLRNNRALERVWKTGLLLAALAVALVGHQGGELTHGKGFYEKAFEQLFGVEAKELGESLEEKVRTGDWKTKKE